MKSMRRLKRLKVDTHTHTYTRKEKSITLFVCLFVYQHFNLAFCRVCRYHRNATIADCEFSWLGASAMCAWGSCFIVFGLLNWQFSLICGFAAFCSFSFFSPVGPINSEIFIDCICEFVAWNRTYIKLFEFELHTHIEGIRRRSRRSRWQLPRRFKKESWMIAIYEKNANTVCECVWVWERVSRIKWWRFVKIKSDGESLIHH